MLADTILKAWNYASELHIDQHYSTASGKKLPYINHIGAVVNELSLCLLHSEGEDYDRELLLVSAILHDSIEDTPATFEAVESKFGTAIARGVNALSKDSSIEKKSDRMIDSLRRIKEEPREISMVKMADRIINLQPPPNYWSGKKVTAYKQEALLIHKELGAANAYLADRLMRRIKEYGK